MYILAKIDWCKNEAKVRVFQDVCPSLTLSFCPPEAKIKKVSWSCDTFYNLLRKQSVLCNIMVFVLWWRHMDFTWQTTFTNLCHCIIKMPQNRFMTNTCVCFGLDQHQTRNTSLISGLNIDLIIPRSYTDYTKVTNWPRPRM